ncbi:MAG: histidine phosphatase family protein [Janthinobacterium lividum]
MTFSLRRLAGVLCVVSLVGGGTGKAAAVPADRAFPAAPAAPGISAVSSVSSVSSVSAAALTSDVDAADDLDDVDVATLILVRHGEKPARGLGQLSCQGLNRALALPYVIEARYGRPDLIVAPNPARQKHDLGIAYDYVRPLATVEPTAIYFGLPVSSALGFAEVDELRAMLLAPAYRRSTILVAGEHRIIETLARRLVVDAGGAASSVPRWDSADYDSIYTLRIVRRAGRVDVMFNVSREGLDGRATRCPGP